MKVALIGLGMVSGTHLAAIRDARFHLQGVLARSVNKTSTVAERLSLENGHPVRAFKDISDLTQDDIDFAIVTTPPDARLQIVTELANAGIPILMEKPIERSLQAATNIVEICEARGVPLGIVFQHRARAASAELKAVVDAGGLGQIATVDVSVPWWRDQSYYDEPGRGTYARDGGGVMISQAIHTLDLMLWLLGPMARVQAMMHTTALHQMEAEDTASAHFELASGAKGTLLATTASYPGGAESISIQGTKAHAHLEAGILTVNYLDGRKARFGAVAGTGGGADPMAFTHDWHQAVIEDFADTVQTGRAPMASGRDALEAHKVIDAMERSNAAGGWKEI